MKATLSRHLRLRSYIRRPEIRQCRPFSASLRHVPSHIERPEYFATGKPRESPRATHIFSTDEIAYMREAAFLARYILDFACSHAVVGRSTDEVDALAHAEMVRMGACPSPLNYYGFPKSICTSLNKVACHGKCFYPLYLVSGDMCLCSTNFCICVIHS